MTDEENLSDFEDKMCALEEAIKRDAEAFYGDRTIKEAYNSKNRPQRRYNADTPTR
ncbi:MAG: hypothetical protein U9O85_02815 [Euryarchaeota archaeon]|nr:hypothetical protein [Euryarchaeota archaeon]